MKSIRKNKKRGSESVPAWTHAVAFFLFFSLVSGTALGQPPKADAERTSTNDDTLHVPATAPSSSASGRMRDVIPYDAEELQKAADQIRRDVEITRNLKNLPNVPLVVRSEEELRSYILERVDELGESVIAAAQRALQLLGVLSDDQDYVEIVTD